MSSDPESAAPPRSSFRVGGMLVGYYVLCPRKAWLSMRGLWMEQESTAVALGRHVDQNSYERERKEIQLTAEAPDGTPLVGKVDWARLDAQSTLPTSGVPSGASAVSWISLRSRS